MEKKEILEITQENKGKLEEGLIFLDFWAPWCEPCRMMMPVIAEMADEVKEKATVCKINVDEEQELAQKYKIRSIPTFIFLKNGEVVDIFVGAQGKDKFIQKIEELSK